MDLPDPDCDLQTEVLSWLWAYHINMSLPDDLELLELLVGRGLLACLCRRWLLDCLWDLLSPSCLPASDGGACPGSLGPWHVTTVSSPTPGEQPAITAPRHSGSSYRLRRATAYRGMGFIWDACYGIFKGEGKDGERGETRCFGEKQVWENRKKGDKMYQSHVIRLLFSKLAWVITERDDCSLFCLITACVRVCVCHHSSLQSIGLGQDCPRTQGMLDLVAFWKQGWHAQKALFWWLGNRLRKSISLQFLWKPRLSLVTCILLSPQI